MNPDATKLAEAARAALKSNGNNIAKTAPKLLKTIAADPAMQLAMVTFYLERMDRQRAKPTSRARPGPHRRSKSGPQRRSTSDKAAALTRSHGAFVHEIFTRRLRGGKQVGVVRIYELPSLIQSAIDQGMEFTNRGFEDFVDAFALAGVYHFCNARLAQHDPNATISDVIKGKDLSGIYDKASVDAAEAMREGSTRLKQVLSERVERVRKVVAS
jgi:hypothetical protein